MEKYCGCLVFDGDDTLWHNTYKYSEPMIKCMQIIYDDLGVNCPHPLAMMQLYDGIDRNNVATFNFSKKRFPTSWVQTYQQLCRERGLEPKKQIEKKLYSTASKFWQAPFPLRKNVCQLLRKMKSRGFYLVLLTVGDPEVQQHKIETTKLKKYFHEIRIVAKNKSEILKELTNIFGQDKVWMIGDSKRSDISAAIKAEVKAFYIPAETWNYENWDCDPDVYQKYVTELKNINELLEIF